MKKPEPFKIYNQDDEPHYLELNDIRRILYKLDVKQYFFVPGDNPLAFNRGSTLSSVQRLVYNINDWNDGPCFSTKRQIDDSIKITRWK